MSPTFTLRLAGLEIPDTAVVSATITALLGFMCWLASHRLRVEGLTLWQTALEMFVTWIDGTIGEVVEEEPRPYVGLIGGLMVFIAVSNTLSVVPFIRPPTAALSTPLALALVVFVAVPYFGIRRRGVLAYLRGYTRPSWILLPLNVVGELTRTLALCVRLFGNAMSGQMIGAIILFVAGFLVPVPLLVLGLLTGLIQAYIFGILAAVYIAAAIQVEKDIAGDATVPEAKKS